MRRLLLCLPLLLPTAIASSLACGPSAQVTNDGNADNGQKTDTSNQTTDNGNKVVAEPVEAGTTQTGLVYAHSADHLYTYDPTSKQLTTIGTIDCATTDEPIIDMAVDKTGHIYATSFTHFYKLDAKTAKCTKIADAPTGQNFPNSLSFVPAGTLDAQSETLVGYATETLPEEIGGDVVNDIYVKVDLGTGAMTKVGMLNVSDTGTRWQASGDIVSLLHDSNRTYLTVKDMFAPATDSLAEINPANGQIVRVLGDTKQESIFGLGYWAGKGYGFAQDGNVVEIDLKTGNSVMVAKLQNNGSPIPWNGAGITTDVPYAPAP